MENRYVKPIWKTAAGHRAHCPDRRRRVHELRTHDHQGALRVRWWSFQLLDGHESNASDQPLIRASVAATCPASVDAGHPNRAAVAHAAAVDSLSARAL
jgi:hypothetical protein